MASAMTKPKIIVPQALFNGFMSCSPVNLASTQVFATSPLMMICCGRIEERIGERMLEFNYMLLYRLIFVIL
jgi:hypothetical protein